MKFCLSRYTLENNLESTGDDIVFIHAFVHLGDEKEIYLPIILTYYTLVEFIEMADPPVGKYLNRIRSGINGYGPKNSKIFKILQEENFDLDKYIIQYVENKDQDYVEKHIEWVNRVQSLSEDENRHIDKSVQSIEEFITADYIKANINCDNFLDEFDQTVHELTLKFFPELFEKGEKYIFMYKQLLTNTTISYCSDIDKINAGKFNPYWEEKYERHKTRDI
ncbi:MAG: hypothetical protein WC716_13550 [Chitinophagaceae bacterium]|jgi:hypothetical protein